MVFFSLPVALGLLTVAQALLVTPSSPQCADLCGNNLASTSGSEITCSDSDYSSSTYGAAFKACLACEMGSTYYDPATQISDLHWAIYNLRFALSWCVFGADNNTQIPNTPCMTSLSCGGLQNAFEFDSLSTDAATYAYCPLMYSVNIPKCTGCLNELQNNHFLANFVIALNAACIQQPALGSTISLQGSLFSTTIVNITTPTGTASSTTYAPSGGGLNLMAKVGIVIGGLVVLLAIGGFLVVCTGKRRRRQTLARKARESELEWEKKHAEIMQQEHATPPQRYSQPFFDSPASQRPFAKAPWGGGDNYEVSPVEKVYFSPYASQYTSPVSAVDHYASPISAIDRYHDPVSAVDMMNHAPVRWPSPATAREYKKPLSPDGPSSAPEWPRDKKQDITTLGMEDDKVESIELRGMTPPINSSADVKAWTPAPLLTRPVRGRAMSIALTESDAKDGNAL